MVRNILKVLLQCEREGLKPQFVEFEQDNGKSVTLDIAKGTFSKDSLQCETTYKSAGCSLHQNKYTVSNAGYHALTMLSDLPSSY